MVHNTYMDKEQYGRVLEPNEEFVPPATAYIYNDPDLPLFKWQAEDRMHRVGKIIPTGNAPAIVECQTLQEVFEILEYKQKRLS